MSTLKDTPILPLVPQYVQALRTAGLAEATVKGYASHVRKYTRWISGPDKTRPVVATVGDVNAVRVRACMSDSTNRGLRPRTVASIRDALNNFAEWLVEMEYIDANTIKTVRKPKLDAATRHLVSDEEVIAMLDACDRFADTRRAAMARAVLSVFVYAGLRRTELTNLRTSDVGVQAGTLYVRHAKGGKSRRLYPCADCMAAVARWMERRGPCTHDYVFDIDGTRRMADEGLNTLLRAVKGAAKLHGHDNIQPHSLRHWCASNLLRNGMDIDAIRVFLGHSQIGTTAVYLHTDEKKLEELRELGALPGAIARIKKATPQGMPPKPKPQKPARPHVTREAQRWAMKEPEKPQTPTGRPQAAWRADRRQKAGPAPAAGGRFNRVSVNRR